MSYSVALIALLIAGGAIVAGAWPICFAIRRLAGLKAGFWSAPLRIAPFALGALPLSLALAALAYVNLEPANLTYMAVFDRSPGPNVSELQSRSRAGPDFREVYLTFRSPYPLPDDLAGRGFKRAEGSSDAKDSGDSPSWWRIAACPDQATYVARANRPWDEIDYVTCRTDGRTYVYASWID